MEKRSNVIKVMSAALFILGVDACDSPSVPKTTVEETYKHERPAWSPNGLKIAFTVRITDSAGVYIVDSTGANLRLVKSGAGIGLTWSPDSKWLAFSVSGSLFKIKENGDSLTQLTNNANDYRPSWSPDGKLIAYVNGGIRALNVVADTIMNIVPYGEYPSWHSNSTEILFFVYAVASNDRYYNEFRTISLADSQENVIISFFSDALAGFSSYSQDGNTILLSLKPPDYSGLSQVFTASLVDFTLDQLTFDGGDYPVWSPNGAKIAYMRTAKDDGGLWIMNTDGSGKHRITTP